jgi:hypothetical protein
MSLNDVKILIKGSNKSICALGVLIFLNSLIPQPNDTKICLISRKNSKMHFEKLCTL